MSAYRVYQQISLLLILVTPNLSYLIWYDYNASQFENRILVPYFISLNVFRFFPTCSKFELQMLRKRESLAFRRSFCTLVRYNNTSIFSTNVFQIISKKNHLISHYFKSLP